jgi:F-type H+-transporting ATPase subunit epsilon
MIAESLTLCVVTPERQLVEEAVDAIQLPARNGYLGILPGHAPLVTELGYGEMSYRTGKTTRYATVFGGFAEVLADRVIVLAEVAERAEEIDMERATAARERAEKRLTKHDTPDLDWNRATLALQRSLIRLQTASKGGAVAAADEEHHAAP